MWDEASAPVRLSCIKFAQRVVLAQTASNGMEAKVRQPFIKLRAVVNMKHSVQWTRYISQHDTAEPSLIRSHASGG